MDIGTYIKDLRVSKNLTQEELGKIVGVQRAAVQKWESGATQNLKRTTIQKLADFFGVSPANFVGNEQPNPKGVKIPVLGYVRAGVPIDAVEEILDYEEITQEMAAQGEHFGLKIKGDSMEPKFSDGDVVIVRKQSNVDNSDIAVVLVNGNEATVKKIKKSVDGIALIPTNPAYDIKFYNNSEIESLPISIIGKVVELRAKF